MLWLWFLGDFFVLVFSSFGFLFFLFSLLLVFSSFLKKRSKKLSFESFPYIFQRTRPWLIRTAMHPCIAVKRQTYAPFHECPTSVCRLTYTRGRVYVRQGACLGFGGNAMPRIRLCSVGKKRNGAAAVGTMYKKPPLGFLVKTERQAIEFYLSFLCAAEEKVLPSFFKSVKKKA